MRPLRLDLTGFTVFRDPTTVDFTDADFFALVGPTGSGKSTVLDAICFALYGTVPRWGGSRGIGNALAPSSAEARVRLVFESAGARYVASRVVRRDGRGNVKTSNAGLQLMPAGFDVSKLDTGLSPDDLGEVLAGTPGEMDEAVLTAVGLPYDQFTSCVVLPQGQFADFLHAKPATRQQILVNLLGLGVYEAVQKRATARAAHAEARLAAIDQLLDGLTEADEATLATAADRVSTMRTLATAVEAAVPELEQARQAVRTASAALATLDAELDELARLGPPDGVPALAEVVTAARAQAAGAAAAVTLAEEREEKLRGRLAGDVDPAALRLLLAAHEDRDRLAAELPALDAELADAESAHRRTVARLTGSRTAAERAEAELEAARRAYQDAQTADRATALRAQLTAGAPCPVCTQPVSTVPAIPAASAVAAAEAAGHAARAAAEAAGRVLAEADRATRDAERAVERARLHREQLGARLTELDHRLAESPGPTALRRELETVAALHRELDDAGGAVRAARETARRSRVEAEAAEERLRAAWRHFDSVRDGIARFGPPMVDRDDLGVAWDVLRGWADDTSSRRRAERAGVIAALAEAEQASATVATRISKLFTDAGLAPLAVGDPAGPSRSVGEGQPPEIDPGRAAAVAVERAEAEHRRLTERREQARQLSAQRGGHESAARTARALAGHLRANNFERWLLAEALDLLVDGGSRILQELTGGQYELIHDKGEFFVVDHHDAGLRRGVRTLSGGETFQASLALALALSEQLAGMSTTTASLESIMLDEGFGTLDVATLDTVAATLEALAARGDRMVGVVTHVPALAERVPVRFEVRKDARSARIERIG